MTNDVLTAPACNEMIHIGKDGISLPSPGEPDQETKNFFWKCASIAVAAIGIGVAIAIGAGKE